MPERCAISNLWPETNRRTGSGAGLQSSQLPGAGTALGRTGRTRLRTLRCRLEPDRTPGAHRRRKGGATVAAARQGSQLTPCSSPRGHPCAPPQYTGTVHESCPHKAFAACDDRWTRNGAVKPCTCGSPLAAMGLDRAMPPAHPSWFWFQSSLALRRSTPILLSQFFKRFTSGARSW
jgi:hypothetical protein